MGWVACDSKTFDSKTFVSRYLIHIRGLDRWFQNICRQTPASNDIWLRTLDSRMPDYRRAITWHMTTVPILDTWYQDIWFQDLWFQNQFRTPDSMTWNYKVISGHLIPIQLIPKPVLDNWFQDFWCQNKLHTIKLRILILIWKPNALFLWQNNNPETCAV